jgi:prevent-host-death family protein
MKSIGAFAAKTHLSELLDRVQHGEQIVIQKRGKSVAALVQFSKVSRARTAALKARVLSGLREVRGTARAGGQARALIDLGRKR